MANSLDYRLAGRADNTTVMQNPALLRTLPWTKDTFREIAPRMHVNRSMITTICHGDTTMFNRTNLVMKSEVMKGTPAIGKAYLAFLC